MTAAWTPAEAKEARRLWTRLGELLGKLEGPPEAIPEPPPKVGLRDVDFADAADALKCDVAAIRAVYEVESRGQGFGDDGRPIILFEPHVFSRLTKHRFDATHGGVSYPTPGAKPYKKTQAERWNQLLYAAKLDRDAAYKSASYGAPQIMGFNFALCAFSDVHAFVEAISRSERDQLFAFVQFVTSSGLADELREHRWAEFARRYNGPAYAKNAYDVKLAAAHAKWSAA
jgi:hypothetical protein